MTWQVASVVGQVRPSTAFSVDPSETASASVARTAITGLPHGMDGPVPATATPMDRADRHRLAVGHVVHEPEREPGRGDRQDAAEDRAGRGRQHHGQRTRERPGDQAGDEDDEGHDRQGQHRARQAAPGADPGLEPGRGLTLDARRREQEVAVARVHDAEPGQRREVRPHGAAPAAPHPARDDDRDEQPDPDRAGEPFELGRLRDGDEVRVEVAREDRPGPDREQDDGDRQHGDQRQDDAQALGARVGGGTGPGHGPDGTGPEARPSRSAGDRGRPAPGSSRR